MLSTAKQEAWTPGLTPKAEPGRLVLLKRIGSTNYKVAVHFSETSTETLDDKIVRLIKREAVEQ